MEGGMSAFSAISRIVILGLVFGGLVGYAPTSVDFQLDFPSNQAMQQEPPPDPAAPADWMNAIQEQISQQEYHITWAEATYLPDLAAGYQAPNRAVDLRTYFKEDGIVVIPRTGYEGEPPWRWELRLTGWGRAEALQSVASAAPTVQENRVEYPRGKALSEWYVNTETGLEQGFSLSEPPGESLSNSPVIIELMVAGDLISEWQPGANGVQFRDPDGRGGLRYSGLLVTDAQGKTLPSRMELNGAVLTLIVEDQGAVYPIQIDPTIANLSEDDDTELGIAQAGAEFGTSVATAGDVNGDATNGYYNQGYSDVIIGAPYYDDGFVDAGKVYIFPGSVIGVLLTPIFEKSSGQANAHYGTSVATAGDVNGDGYADVIIGAPEWDDGQIDEGGAWVFHGGSAGPDPTPDSYKQSNQADARLGHSVAFAGDVNCDGFADIIVGAPLYTNVQSEEGRVWVWHGSSDGVLASSDWQAESNQINGGLGNSVSTAGDVNGDGYADIIVGAQRYTNGQTEEGLAFVWHGSSIGINFDVYGTPANAQWTGEVNDDDARFGYSVSTAGDVNGDGYADVIVGAPYFSNGAANQGGAWVYHGSADGVLDAYDNRDEGEQANAHFGWSVALAGDVNGDGYADVIVGAPDNDDTNDNEGSAYVWYGHASGISSTRDWNDQGLFEDAFFGKSVATAGDVNGDGYSDIIVGAPGRASAAGKAFIYHGGPDGPQVTAGWTKTGERADANFGFSVSTAGDVNGDGYADVIIGAPYWDEGQTNEGKVHVYHGSAGGLLTSPAWHKQGDQVSAWFGYSVGWAGDVNGDGYDDVIVGAPYYDYQGEVNEGMAWIYRGSSTGLVGAPYWQKDSDQAEAHFGWSVAGAGDVNGDGYADVIVGAPDYNHALDDEGMAWVYHGSASGVHTTPDWDYDSNQVDARLGYSVASAGDVNRDGYSDVIVGAPYWEDDANANEGRAWVFHGSRAGLKDVEDWHAESNFFNGQLGFSVASAGDVNGDGYSEVIIGSPYHDDSRGRVWVYHGGADGLNDSLSWWKTSGVLSTYYGYSVAGAGDVNGDGYADVVLGAPLWQDLGGETDEGVARVYLGSSTGLESSPNWLGAGDDASGWYGVSVASAGDVNGDGYAEIIIGADHYDVDAEHLNEGKAFVYYGGGGRGVSLNPRQQNNDGAPLAHLGRTRIATTVRIRWLEQSPFGRGNQAFEHGMSLLSNPGSVSIRWSGYYYPIEINESLYFSFTDCPTKTVCMWKLRWLYDPATTPWMPRSRWVTNPWNGQKEADFRAGGSIIYLPLARR